MDDIVEELVLLQSGAQWACGATAETLGQAADEITRLRAERAELRQLLVGLGAGIPAAAILRAEDRHD